MSEEKPPLDGRPKPGSSTESSHQWQAGIAIGVGALVVLVLMLLVASGATHALWP